MHITCTCGNRIEVYDNPGDEVTCCNCDLVWLMTGQKYTSRYICHGCGVTGNSALGSCEKNLCGPCYNMGLRLVGGKLCAQVSRFLDLHDPHFIHNCNIEWLKETTEHIERIKDHQGWI